MDLLLERYLMRDLFTVDINGKKEQVAAEVVDRQLWFKLKGEVYAIQLNELNENKFTKSKSSGKSVDKIAAPMPGKITKLFVSGGQNVNKGDALLVMEAMKMEYTLKADINAKVEKLSVQVGDQVVLSQLLIQLTEILVK